MYTSPDVARSDLFLAGGVFLFGPVLLDLFFGLVPVLRIPIVGTVLLLAWPLSTTVLVPYLLLRYRGESLRDYGLGSLNLPDLGYGLLAAAPIGAAALVAAAVEGGSLSGAAPVLRWADPQGWIFVTVRILSWVGVSLFAVYATVKARDAFSSEYGTVRDQAERIGRILGIVALVATALMLVLAFELRSVLLPLGVAAAVAIPLRAVTGPSATSRATMLAPVLVFGLASFSFGLLFSGQALVPGVWMAAMCAGVGLLVGLLRENGRSAFTAVGVALMVAGFSTLQLLRI